MEVYLGSALIVVRQALVLSVQKIAFREKFCHSSVFEGLFCDY